jgi:hypothetical protein
LDEEDGVGQSAARRHSGARRMVSERAGNARSPVAAIYGNGRRGGWRIDRVWRTSRGRSGVRTEGADEHAEAEHGRRVTGEFDCKLGRGMQHIFSS